MLVWRESSARFESAQQTYRSLICLAIVKKACSTFVAFLADVSRKGMFNWSANSCTSSSRSFQ